MPNSPQHEAGMRIEPPPSAVRAAARRRRMAPPDEPPGVRSRSYGLRAAPFSSDS
jgi:hypothetical protein